MRGFLMRLLLATAVTLVAFAPASSAHAQQADEDAPPVSPRQQAKTTSTPQQPNDQTASAADPQTQEALVFTGRVVREKGQIVLNDPVTKVSYQLYDQSKAKQYVGKPVKVTGRLDMSSNTIHIVSIEPLT